MWEVVSAHRSEQRMGRCWRWRRRGDNAVITNSTQGWGSPRSARQPALCTKHTAQAVMTYS